MNIRPANTFDADEPLSKAISEVSKNGIPVVITKNNKFYGIIDDRTLRQAPLNPQKTKCETVAVRCPKIDKESSLLEICNSFFSGRWKALPVFEKGKVSGIITRSDVIKVLMDEGVLSGYNVNEIMSSPAITIESNATLANAKSMMRKENVRRLVVTKEGILEGILSTYDLANVLMQKKEKESIISDKVNLELKQVSSFMRENIETAETGMRLDEIAKIMADKELSTLVVQEGVRPVGVISAKDVFETVISAAEEESRIYISGLDEEDKEMYQEIEEYCKSEIVDKLRKSFEVRALFVHVKKHEARGRRNKYSLRVRLRSKELVTVSAFEWDLPLALRQAKDELTRVMMKKKPNRMHERV